MENVEILQAIFDYIEENISKYAKEITNEQLTDNGAIYYMNGNDGTGFDFKYNGRTCEFMKFYKSTELGLIKAYLTADGFIKGYLWKDEGKAEAIHLEKVKLTKSKNAKEFAIALFEEYDEKRKWDEIIRR